MGQRIDMSDWPEPAIEPTRAPSIHFTTVEQVRVDGGMIYMVLVEEQLRADGGVDRVVVARINTEMALTRNSFAKVMMAVESTPEGRRARMD